MSATRTERRSLSDTVYEHLRDAIVDDEVVAGSLLPAERDLAQQYGVNRQMVREALQRLRQMHLVDIVHGGGARVRDWRRTADIALLPELVTRADGTLRARPALALTHLRVSLGVSCERSTSPGGT